MDLEKLEKLAKLVLHDLPHSGSFERKPHFAARFRNLMIMAAETLPEYKGLFDLAQHSVNECYQANSVIYHLLEILKIEKESNLLIKEMKIFEGAEEKMKQAGLSFQNEDYVSTFNNLNTAFELIIKDKVGIPTTITKIKTANIIEVLVKEKVEPHLYFNEVRKRIIDIDNKVKHQGYSPTKIDAINGIKAMEELLNKLRNVDLNLSDEVRNKICEGL
jgi:hypothetical protein